MSIFRIFSALLGAVVTVGLLAVVPAHADASADDVRSRLGSIERWEAYTTEKPSDNNSCRRKRAQLERKITVRRDQQNARFVRDLSAQINRHGDDEVRVSFNLVDSLGLLEIHSAMDSATVTGVTFIVDGSIRVSAQADGAEAQLVAARKSLRKTLRRIDRNLAAQDADDPDDRHEIEHLEAERARYQAGIDGFALETARVDLAHVEGLAVTVLAGIPESSIFSASLTADDLTTVPSVVRRVQRQRDLDRAGAIEWINANPDQATRYQKRYWGLPQNTFIFFDLMRNCAEPA